MNAHQHQTQPPPHHYCSCPFPLFRPSSFSAYTSLLSYIFSPIFIFLTIIIVGVHFFSLPSSSFSCLSTSLLLLLFPPLSFLFFSLSPIYLIFVPYFSLSVSPLFLTIIFFILFIRLITAPLISSPIFFSPLLSLTHQLLSTLSIHLFSVPYFSSSIFYPLPFPSLFSL